MVEYRNGEWNGYGMAAEWNVLDSDGLIGVGKNGKSFNDFGDDDDDDCCK